MIAAADREQDAPLRAVVALRELPCKRVGVEQPTIVRDEWLAELAQRRGG